MLAEDHQLMGIGLKMFCDILPNMILRPLLINIPNGHKETKRMLKHVA